MAEKRLGRKAVVRDSRTLRMSKYLTTQLPPPPPQIDWTKGQAEWGMLLNDRLGCCTCAGVAHAVQVWSSNSSIEATVTDDDVLGAYEAWCGYNPADPTTDQGGIELDVLKAWKKDTFVNHQLTAYAVVNPSFVYMVKQAIALFGGVYIGFNVPRFVMAEETPKVWDYKAAILGGQDATIVGGHCVYVAGYSTDTSGITTFKLISWGQVYEMTEDFWAKFVDECYALLALDWIEPKCPVGLNLTELLTDLAAIN